MHLTYVAAVSFLYQKKYTHETHTRMDLTVRICCTINTHVCREENSPRTRPHAEPGPGRGRAGSAGALALRAGPQALRSAAESLRRCRVEE